MITDVNGTPVKSDRQVQIEKEAMLKKYQDNIKKAKAAQKARLADMREEIEFLQAIADLNELREEVAGKDKYLMDNFKITIDEMFRELNLGKEVEDKIIGYYGWNRNDAVKEEIKTIE